MANGRIKFFIDQRHHEWLDETLCPLPSPDFVLPAMSSIAFIGGKVILQKAQAVSRFLFYTKDWWCMGDLPQLNNKLVTENVEFWDQQHCYFQHCTM
ncbi:hypothetical protein JCM8547_003202 [Rhodosporidiobolus lusitaniae]